MNALVKTRKQNVKNKTHKNSSQAMPSVGMNHLGVSISYGLGITMRFPVRVHSSKLTRNNYVSSIV